jgi:hypothetical protein
MCFIVTSNTLDSNRNTTFVIQNGFFFTLWTCTMGDYIELVSNANFPKVKVRSAKLALKKKITCKDDVFTNTMLRYEVLPHGNRDGHWGVKIHWSCGIRILHFSQQNNLVVIVRHVGLLWSPFSIKHQHQRIHLYDKARS